MSVPVVLIFVPPRVNPETAFTTSPEIVPDAVIEVAPAIEPVFVIPPLLLLIPPVISAPAAVTNNPFAPVIRPADVIVPVPVVLRFPEVVALPASSIDNVIIPLSLTRIALLVAAFVSLIISDGAIPAFVKTTDVAVPELLD